jgi:hypothetical protein
VALEGTKGYRSARFDPGTPAKFTLGALLEPLFRQFLTAVVSAVGPPLLRLRSEGREGYRNTHQDGTRQAISPRSNTTA